MSDDPEIGDGPVALYLAEIEAYERTCKTWWERGERDLKRYRDDDGKTDPGRSKRFNILWSNVETLKPFLYSQSPKPVVRRRYEQEDPVALAGGRVLQNSLSYIVAENHFGTSMRSARDDYLLIGRGTIWVRYVAPTGNDIATESVACDWVHWRDFGHNVARVWAEVGMVWRWVYLTRAQLTERFGDKGQAVALDWGTKPAGDNDGDERNVAHARARVCELWDMATRKAYWFTRSSPEFLDERDDPLGLDEFFPCPRPMYATLTTDSLIPIADYWQYRDQAEQMDELTARIAALTKAVRVVGVYDASVPALKRLLTEAGDNTLIPVDSFAAMAEKGGLSGSIELLPVKEIAETLIALHEARDKVKADLYEVTGMSDIIRGSTNPEETATAQGIKSRFATMRLDERQREMERMVRNTVAIAADVIAGRFDPETLKRMSGVQLPDAPAPPLPQTMPGQPPAPMPDASEADWTGVIAMLRDRSSRRFKIDVELGSTVAGQDQEDQQARMAFLDTAGKYLQQAMEIGRTVPQMMPLLGQMLLFAVRGFPVAAELEEQFDKFVAVAEAVAKNPPPAPPSPQLAKVQAQQQEGQARLAMDQQQQQVEQQQAAQQAQADQQAAAAKAQSDAQLVMMKAHMDAQAEQQRLAMEAQSRQQEAMISAVLDRFKAQLDARTKIEVAEITAGATLDAAQIGAANQGADA